MNWLYLEVLDFAADATPNKNSRLRAKRLVIDWR